MHCESSTGAKTTCKRRARPLIVLPRPYDFCLRATVNSTLGVIHNDLLDLPRKARNAVPHIAFAVC